MFGDKMKAARLSLGYSAEQVAAHLNISPATVYRYENGDIEKMPAKTLKALADYLCVTQGYLMGWSDEEAYIPLTNDEHVLLDTYRSLPQEGKQYIQKQLTFATMEYGGKSEDLSSSRPG